MKTYLFISAGLGFVLLSAILFYTSSDKYNFKSEKPENILDQELNKNRGNESEAKSSFPSETSRIRPVPRTADVEPVQQKAPQSSVNEKTEILLKIDESVSLYSDEGVEQIAPLLLSPDPEIREGAIEGMKQLGLPKAAVALREAAMKGTTFQKDREAMLEAAEFVELPPYQLKNKKD